MQNGGQRNSHHRTNHKMFCCNGASRTYDPLDTTAPGKNKYNNNPDMKKSSKNPYPGSRRQNNSRGLTVGNNPNQAPNLIGTGGNALMACDPQTISSDPTLLKVIVPLDSVPGQSLIQITAPDGSGRVVLAIVPHHLKPGSSFLLKFPTVEETSLLNDLRLQQESEAVNGGDSSNNNNNDNNNTPGAGGDMSSNNNNNANSNNTTPTDLLDENPLEQRLLQDYDQLNPNTNKNSNTNNSTGTSTSNNSSVSAVDIDVHGLMIVSVPPGAEAGSTIYASIPGPLFDVPGIERRFVPVTIPNGGISQFYTTFSLKYIRTATLTEEQVREEERKRVEAAFGGAVVPAGKDSTHPGLV